MQVQQKKGEGGEEEGEIQVKLKFKQKLLEEGGEEEEEEEEEIQVKMKLEPKMLEEEGEKEEVEDQEGDWLNC